MLGHNTDHCAQERGSCSHLYKISQHSSMDGTGAHEEPSMLTSYWQLMAAREEKSFLFSLKHTLDLFLFYVCRCLAYGCICAPCVCFAHRDQQRVPDPPELELQRVVSDHVCAGSQTWVLWRSVSALNPWAIQVPESHFPLGVWLRASDLCSSGRFHTCAHLDPTDRIQWVVREIKKRTWSWGQCPEGVGCDKITLYTYMKWSKNK